MNIRILLMVGFIIEIIAETGFGFKRVIFVGFSLKNLLLLLLLLAVFTAGNKVSERRKRFVYSKGVHRNYLLYLLTVIVATSLAYVFINFPHYSLIQVILAIKSTILDPYLVFLVFLMYPLDKLEFEKVFKLITIFITVLAGMTVLASVVSPGIFFGVDNDAARPNGPFGEPNMTAAVLSMFLLPVIAPLVESKKFSYLKLFSALVLLGCILATGSRGGLLAVVVAVAYYLFSMRKYLGAGKKITIFISGIFGIIIFWLLLPDSTRDLVISRLGVFDSSHIDWQVASAGRTGLWALAIQEWLKSPVFGIGWMGYTTMFGNPTHNSYLEILVSSGPVGLLFYGLVIKNIFASFNINNKLQTVDEIIILKGYKSAAVAIFSAVFFVNLYIPWLVVWAMFGLMVGYSYTFNDKNYQKVKQDVKNDNAVNRVLSFKKSGETSIDV